MKTATVRDLRNSFAKLEAWLLEGEDIRIEKRGQPIGLLKAWTGVDGRGLSANREAGFRGTAAGDLGGSGVHRGGSRGHAGG